MKEHSQYEAVIGLEVHAQLLTQSKMFCSCATRFKAEPNVQVCPVCSGMPGSLPVINRRAIEFATKAALALHCTVNEKSVFARKNYFYPDLPKGYQISQYDQPFASNGYLEIEEGRCIRIERLHLEEDAGKLVHRPEWSEVNLNRAGVPLIEIVSQPDLRSPADSANYMRKLRAILVELEICDGNMEEGSLRCDGNISVRLRGTTQLGTKTEVKNMNSFRFLEAALEYEIKRQIEVVSRGERLVQETRLWDPEEEETRSMRSKEEAHDYRYFPEPDLHPVKIDAAWLQRVASALPELPDQKRIRFISQYELPPYDAEILVSEKGLSKYFEECCKQTTAAPKKVSNWILTELLAVLKRDNIPILQCTVSPASLGELLKMIEKGEISGKMGKEIFATLFERPGKLPSEIVKESGLGRIADMSVLEGVINQVVAANPKQVEQYLEGKDKLFGFFVGQVMQKTKGQADPELTNRLIREKLSSMKRT